LRRRQNAQLDREEGYGERGTDAYLGAAENFDASGALNQYARGAWGSISEALGTQLQSLRGNAVGAGRFDSGFYDEDQGELVNRATGQFSNAIAQQSMGALAAQQRNTEGLGEFASERSGRALDLTAAQREEEENAFREEQARKRRRRSGIGSAIGGILGAAAGSVLPGIGTVAGARLGGGLGGAVASW
jgi:hypothetical protein